jgi:hypothetical protein
MALDCRAPLRVGEVHVAHGRRDVLMAENALYLGEIDVGLKKI